MKDLSILCFDLCVVLFYRLCNLFYGLDERSPLRADLYVSMVKLAQQADLIQELAINLEQVLSDYKIVITSKQIDLAFIFWCKSVF